MSERSTRRGAIGRSLGLLGGLAGLGAATATPARGATTLVFHGRAGHTHATGRRPGAVPRAGDRLTGRVELLDRPDGRSVGELHSAAFALRGPGGSGAERLELHTFVLRDGTIVGSGAAGDEHDTLAILGGTGRYAGARGTYAVRPAANGGATYTLTLL